MRATFYPGRFIAFTTRERFAWFLFPTSAAELTDNNINGCMNVTLSLPNAC